MISSRIFTQYRDFTVEMKGNFSLLLKVRFSKEFNGFYKF